MQVGDNMKNSSVSVRTLNPIYIGISSLCSFAFIIIAFTLQLGCYAPSGSTGSLYLDGKQLPTSAGEIILDGGKYTLTVTGSGAVQFSGSILGPGELRVALPQSVTLQLEGEISQVRLVVESGTVDLTKAVDRSGNVTVAGSGVVKRLANPIDISASLRLWFDASRAWTLYQDLARVSPVSVAGQEVRLWQSLDRWRGLAATNDSNPAHIYVGPDVGVRFNQNSLSLPDIEIRNEYTLGAVFRPYSLSLNKPACVLTGWTNIGSDLSLCYYSSTDGSNISRLLVSYYLDRWYYVKSFIYDMTVDGTKSKFSVEANRDTIVTSSGDALGTTLQLGGQLISSGSVPIVTRDDARFIYYIGRRWDAFDYLNMDLRELVVANDSKVSDALNGYLAWHNGLQSQLDSSHPYKLAPPTAVIDQSGTSVYRPCDGGKSCLVSFQAACSPRCTISARCGTNGDCASGNCIDYKCALPTCSPNCTTGSVCGADSDCVSRLCLQGFCYADSLCTPKCLVGELCASSADCAAQNCTNNLCALPACSPNCKTGSICTVPGDCLSGVCTNSVCAAPACAATTAKCPVDSKCSVDTECASSSCRANVCKSCAPSCGIGVACTVDSDCFSGVCGATKVCASPACSPKCMAGAKCVAGTDCISTKCSTSNLCEANTCSPGCLKDVGCSAGSECLSKSCVNNVCAAPTCSPNCKAAEACYGNGDCLSNICDKNKCTALTCWTAATKCGQGTKCSDNTQCASGTCQNFVCSALACSPNCKFTEACFSNADCLSNQCASNKCTALPCWTATPKCGSGTKCADNTQCASGTCQNFVCT